jgi:glucosamine-6-phosphate deaminase
MKYMNVQVFPTPLALGQAAGSAAARLIRQSISEKGHCNIILATGTSQFETLKKLTEENIEWSKVVMFHLDEYIGISVTHPASFRKYLTERFVSMVPSLQAAHLINGEFDPIKECERLGNVIRDHPIDVALIGIGENGHLAFNDPPADLETVQPYIIVSLDDACRRQQLGEGWFKNIDAVPKKAISMSINQILKSKHIICSVPDSRKAEAVRKTFEKPVSNMRPASALQGHSSCTIFLDLESAALLPSADTRVL